MTSDVVRIIFAILSLQSITVQAQAQSANRAEDDPLPQIPLALADLDGDGLVDVLFTDLDRDGLTDIVTLGNSKASHDVVKNSINNIRAMVAETDLGDLDGDGRPERALLGSAAEVRAPQDGRRGILSMVRRELASGQVIGVNGLIAAGWLAPGATGGDPLAHLIPTCPTGPVSGPIPVPYPDPENPGSGGTGGTSGGGSSIPISNGNDAGVSTGIIKRPPPG